MMSVDVNKMHVQLRRLKNESVLLKDASITAVPNHRSKVSLWNSKRTLAAFDFRTYTKSEKGIG